MTKKCGRNRRRRLREFIWYDSINSKSVQFSFHYYWCLARDEPERRRRCFRRNIALKRIIHNTKKRRSTTLRLCRFLKKYHLTTQTEYFCAEKCNVFHWTGHPHKRGRKITRPICRSNISGPTKLYSSTEACSRIHMGLLYDMLRIVCCFTT